MIELRDPGLLRVGAAVAAAVLLVYVVRRRARRVEVPFLPLWQGVARRAGGGLGARVVRRLDLLFVLLACAALALALAGPFVPGTPSTVRDLVLVVDGGVELRAGQRAARLATAAEGEIGRRVPGTRFAIVRATAAGARIATTDDPERARAVVRAHDPGWRPVDPAPALALGRTAAERLRDPDLVLVTARPVDAPGYRRRAIVEPAPDARLEALEVVTDPEGEGRLLRVVLDAPSPVTVGDRPLGRREGVVPLPGSGERTLPVRMAGDRFPPDDAIHVVLPATRAPRVLVVTRDEPSPFLVAALEALERVGAVEGPLERTTPARCLDAAERADVLVFDRCAPPRPSAGLPAIYLAPEGGAPPFRVGPRGDAPALFEVRGDHPLLAGFDLARIPPLRARAILGGEPVAQAATGPAVAAGPHWVALGFDPDGCLLAASPAYPLLLRNAIEMLAQSAPAREPEYHRVGEPAPDGGPWTAPDGRVVGTGRPLAGPPGFWRAEDGRAIAVNLLAEGLDLRAAEPDPRRAPGVGRPPEPERPLGALFAAGAIALLLVSWWLDWRA